MQIWEAAAHHGVAAADSSMRNDALVEVTDRFPLEFPKGKYNQNKMNLFFPYRTIGTVSVVLGGHRHSY